MLPCFKSSNSKALVVGRGGRPLQHFLPPCWAPDTRGLCNGQCCRLPTREFLWLPEVEGETGTYPKVMGAHRPDGCAREPGLGSRKKPREAGLAPQPLDALVYTLTRINSKLHIVQGCHPWLRAQGLRASPSQASWARRARALPCLAVSCETIPHTPGVTRGGFLKH